MFGNIITNFSNNMVQLANVGCRDWPVCYFLRQQMDLTLYNIGNMPFNIYDKTADYINHRNIKYTVYSLIKL